jgi:hypothetical protein
MSPVVYLLRSPVEHLSPSLYSTDDREAVVVRLNPVGSAPSGELAEVLQPGEAGSLTAGQYLSGGQLMELLLHAPKVITL